MELEVFVLKQKFLVVNIFFSQKSGKYFATGYFWNAEHNKWADQRRSDGSYGPSLIEVSKDFYDSASPKLSAGLIASAEVSGYRGQYPIFTLK